MSKQCNICGRNTIFYIWSTSRNFNLEEYCKVKCKINKTDRIGLKRDGEVVCYTCKDKYNLVR